MPLVQNQSDAQQKEPERREVLSYSRLSVVSDCAEKYRLRYVEGIRGPRGIRMLVGSAVHKGIEFNLRHMAMNDLAMADLDAVQTVTRDALATDWKKGEVWYGADINEEAAMAEAVDAAIDYTTTHFAEIAPQLEPEAMEVQGTITTPLGFDIALVKDIIERDGTVRDTKTRTRKANEHEAALSDQLALYAIHSELQGKPAPRVVLDVLVRTRGGKAYAQTLTAPPPSKGRQDRVVALLERAHLSIASGVFMPNPGSNLCSRSYCEFAQMGICPFWSGRE